jgi:hypothetical protein
MCPKTSVARLSPSADTSCTDTSTSYLSHWCSEKILVDKAGSLGRNSHGMKFDWAASRGNSSTVKAILWHNRKSHLISSNWAKTGWSGFEIPIEDRDFVCSLNGPDRLWVPPDILLNRFRSSCPGWKRSRPESSAEGKNQWSYTFIPPICLYDWYRVTFP